MPDLLITIATLAVGGLVLLMVGVVTLAAEIAYRRRRFDVEWARLMEARAQLDKWPNPYRERRE